MDDQRSDAWFASRLGRVTASRISDLRAKTKSGYSTSRKNYAMQLALERVTGQREESYTNAAMQRGTDLEPVARAVYEAHASVFVTEVGFIAHPVIENSGASPDGMVGDDGLVEIKVPNSATHYETMVSKKPDGRYIDQMQWQMACTGRQWCDFVSYDDRFPEKKQLIVIRVPRDDDYISELEAEVKSFLDEVQQIVNNILE